MSDCSFNPDPNTCGTNATCVQVSATQKACLQRCSAPYAVGVCRTGYRCVPDGQTQFGVCFPNCDNPGFTCPSGKVCQSSGAFNHFCCDANGTNCL